MKKRAVGILAMLIGSLLFVAPAKAQDVPDVSGIWGTKFGDMVVVQEGDKLTGTLVKTSGYCPFKNGEKILKGIIMEDSLAGEYRMCQADDDCGPPVWAHALLLVADRGSVLTGSASSKKAVCPLVGFSKNAGGERGLYFRRLGKLSKKARAAFTGKPAAKKSKPENVKEKAKPDDKRTPGKSAVAENPETRKNPEENAGKESEPKNDQRLVAIPKEVVLPGPPAPPGTYDPRAAVRSTKKEVRLLMEGKQFLQVGQFEKAKKKFEQALKLDRKNPNALVGIGVALRSRNAFDQALTYYKKALAADPNYGMAYYNMACVYALQKKPEMALRYLKIAVMNGFVVKDVLDKDPDLESLRELAEYKELKRGEF